MSKYKQEAVVASHDNLTDRFLQQYVRPGLNIFQLQQIKAVFDVFDPSSTGYVAPKDIKAAIQREGPESVANPLYQLVCNLDQEGAGRIDFEKFVYFLTTTVTGQEPEEEIREMFELFDDEKTGYISIASLRRAASQYHLDWQEEDLQQMIRQADTDGDGFVNFQQFASILSYKASLK